MLVSSFGACFWQGFLVVWCLLLARLIFRLVCVLCFIHGLFRAGLSLVQGLFLARPLYSFVRSVVDILYLYQDSEFD